MTSTHSSTYTVLNCILAAETGPKPSPTQPPLTSAGGAA
jgi:hypothetical protein